MAGSKQALSFAEEGRNALHKNYKLTTADTSLVCDGSNWETLRVASKNDVPNNYRPRSHSSSRSRNRTRSSSRDKKSFSHNALRLENSQQDSHERRHSNDGSTSQSAHIRMSQEDLQSVRPSSGSRMTVRKLSEPMHRCSTTNQTVSSIMRPAKYSSNNLAALGKSTLVNCGEKNDTNQPSDVGYSIDDDEKPTGDTSFGSNKISRCVSVPNFSDAKWIASGVDFSKSMEVYVFKN